MEFELGRRQFAMASGVLFGFAWLVFLDTVAHNNYCLGGVEHGDPCKWGFANSTRPVPPTDHGTPAPAPPYGGWQALDGRRALVFVPGILALVSIFMINTVDLKDLELDREWVVGGSPMLLKLWMFLGACCGFSALAMSIWVHVTIFAAEPDVDDGVGVGGMLSTLMITISSLGLWLARSYGLASGWGDMSTPLNL